MTRPLDYHRPGPKAGNDNSDPALQALLWGLLMGIVLAMLLGALAAFDRHQAIAANSTLIRKLLFLTPLWLTAIAYAGLIRSPRTRTRVACAIICTVIACVVAAVVFVGVPALIFYFSGLFD